jgi:methyl-accepting chemotaxis protein
VLNLGTISGQVQNSIQQLPATNPEQTQLKEILNKLQQWVEKLPEPTIKSQDKADALQQVETIAKSASETTEQNKGILRTALKALKGFSAEVNETVSDSNKIINEVNELFKQIKAILMLE